MIADELVTILGVELKGNALNNIRSMEAGISKLASVAKAASVVVAGLAAGATLMVNSVTAQAAELQKTADKTGVAVEQLQELDYIAAKTGTDAKVLRNDVIALTKSMSSPIPGQFNMNLMMLGVSANKAGGGLKTSAELLGDIAGKLQGMSQQRQLQWAQKVGISDETLLALKSGKEGIKALAEEAHKLGFVIPAESIKRAADFRKELGTMRLYLDRLKQSVVIGLLPVFERLLSWFKELVDYQSGSFMKSLEDFSRGVVMAWDTFEKILEPVSNEFNKIKKSIEEFLGPADKAEMWGHLILGSFESLLLLLAPIIAKWTLLAGAVGLVALAIEDLFAYFTGGQESLMGTWAEELEQKIVNLINKFSDLNMTVEDFDKINTKVELVASTPAWLVIYQNLDKLTDKFKKASESIGKSLKDKALDMLEKVEKVIDKISKALQKVIALFTEGKDSAAEFVEEAKETIKQKVSDTGRKIKNWVMPSEENPEKEMTGYLQSRIAREGSWFPSPMVPGMGMSLLPAYMGAPRVSGGDTNTNIYITTNDAETAGRTAGTVANNPNLIHTAMTPGNVSPVMR